MNTYYVALHNHIHVIEADHVQQNEGMPLTFVNDKEPGDAYCKSVAQFATWDMWAKKGHIKEDMNKDDK
jgi:hypothetical protein